MTQEIAVVGAGWAGLSCAHHLLGSGRQVTLIDSAPQPGGRARSAPIRLDGRTVNLDNGQHMLIGGYAQTIDLIRHVQRLSALRRVPLQFQSDRITIARRGPGRFGLVLGVLTGRGLTLPHRIALMRAGLRFARQGWAGFEGKSVTELLTMTGQTDDLIDTIWRPLCVAALNTEPGEACAQTFVNVLYDALFTDGRSSDFLISQQPLSDLLPTPLLADMRQRGLTWIGSRRIQELSARDRGGWILHSRDHQQEYDAVVLATPWHVSAALLTSIAPAAATVLNHFRDEPIRTVYLAWPELCAARIPAIAMLREQTNRGWHGQWIFSRGTQDDMALAAVVVSAAGPITADNDDIASAVAKQVSEQLNLPAPLDQRCVNEKRATFLCTPGRPVVSATQAGDQILPRQLLLAGDYCLHRYPATLEAATVSGRIAAQTLWAP